MAATGTKVGAGTTASTGKATAQSATAGKPPQASARAQPAGKAGSTGAPPVPATPAEGIPEDGAASDIAGAWPAVPPGLPLAVAMRRLAQSGFPWAAYMAACRDEVTRPTATDGAATPMVSSLVPVPAQPPPQPPIQVRAAPSAKSAKGAAASGTPAAAPAASASEPAATLSPPPPPEIPLSQQLLPPAMPSAARGGACGVLHQTTCALEALAVEQTCALRESLLGELGRRVGAWAWGAGAAQGGRTAGAPDFDVLRLTEAAAEAGEGSASPPGAGIYELVAPATSRDVAAMRQRVWAGASPFYNATSDEGACGADATSTAGTAGGMADGPTSAGDGAIAGGEAGSPQRHGSAGAAFGRADALLPFERMLDPAPSLTAIVSKLPKVSSSPIHVLCHHSRYAIFVWVYD